jgi:hypothetical protein
MSKIAELELGAERLVVFEKDVLFENIDKISEEYSEVKTKHSLFAKYPMKDGESSQEWQERVLPLLAAESNKLDKESNKDYLARIYKLSLDKHKLTIDTIKMLAKVFGQEAKATDASFKKCSFVAARKFVVTVFEACCLPTRDFE